MKNQIFQPTRFLFYLKKSLFERHTSLLNITAVFFLLSLAIGLYVPYIKGYYQSGAYSIQENINIPDPMWGAELSIFVFLWIASCIMCFDIFSPLAKKTDRLRLLTCPASSLEKFCSGFLIYAIAVPILLVILIFLADAIRVWIYRGVYPEITYIKYISPDYLLSFGCAEKYLPALPQGLPLEEMKEFSEYLHNMAAVKYSSILFCGLFLQAVYALGTTVWPKKSGVKTSAFLLIMGIACGTLFFVGIKCFYSFCHLSPRDFGIDNSMTQLLIVELVVTALIIFIWWITFRRFKEWEVIKRW